MLLKLAKLKTFLIILGATYFSVSSAWGHAFGSRYDLPLPLWLYLFGAGSSVGLSFLVMVVFFNKSNSEKHYIKFDLLTFSFLKWLTSQSFVNLIKTLSILLFIFLLLAGFYGDPNPLNNITSIYIWVIWWVGMAFFSALIGNLWSLINPWTIFFTFFTRRIGKSQTCRPYPVSLDRWPSVLLLFIFAWMELISEQAEDPQILSCLILIYSVITWVGMTTYGKVKWLENGEVFHVIFSLLARFAPLYRTQKSLYIRIPSTGLIVNRPISFAESCFVILFLSTVTFDGILETPIWASILNSISESLSLRPLLILMQEAGINLIMFIKTIALIGIPTVFFIIFAGFCHLTAELGSSGRMPTLDVIGYFVLSLVPIAIAYHLAHYLTYLLIAGQQIIPLTSDPFNLGWNLFGTSDYVTNIGIINAKVIWYFAISAIIIGHVFAIYIAHIMALEIFSNKKMALSSQYPMMAMMIGYTMISLWVLSQPIIE